MNGPMKTKAQALRDLGRVVAEVREIVSTLTVREAVERVWYPGPGFPTIGTGPNQDPSLSRCDQTSSGTGGASPAPARGSARTSRKQQQTAAPI